MDHPSDEKTESCDTNQDEIKNLDKALNQTDETSEKINESIEMIKSDNEATLIEKGIEVESSDKGNINLTEMDIQVFPTDSKTEKNQGIKIKIKNISKINNEAIETRTEDKQIQSNIVKTENIINVETYGKPDPPNESKQESLKDNRKKGKKICSVDSTTDEETVIIDLSDDQSETCEIEDNGNNVGKNIDFKNDNECDSNNKSVPEKMENSNEKNCENITSSNSNEIKKEDEIIDLCDDDPIEIFEQNDGSIQQGMVGITAQNEKEAICDDTPKLELKNKEITNEDGLEEPCETTDENMIEEACELTDEDETTEACMLTNENKPKEAFQNTGEIVREGQSKAALKYYIKGVDSGDSCVSKDIGQTENRGGMAMNDKSDETEMRTKNEEYKNENFRFKDDIITLQEDYGMYPKQTSNESSFDVEKTDKIAEDTKYTILDESDSEEKQCKFIECEPEDRSETNTKISELSQSDSKIEKMETDTKLKTEETEGSKGNLIHEKDNKSSVNEQEDVQIIQIKNEIEDDSKDIIGKGIKENISSSIEMGEHSSILYRAIDKQEKYEDNIQESSTSKSTKFLPKDIKGILLDNSNQLTVTEGIKNEFEVKKKSITNNDREVTPFTDNVQLSINLDNANPEENNSSISAFGCALKSSNEKICQTTNNEDDIKNTAFFNDTPPSLSDSDSNEEFYDAEEFIPEGTVTRETSLTIKPKTAIGSTQSLSLMNEPLPGPSGISSMKNSNETPVVMAEEEKEENVKEATDFSSDKDTICTEGENNMSSETGSTQRDDTNDGLKKMKESRKYDETEDDNKNENQKKIKLD